MKRYITLTLCFLAVTALSLSAESLSYTGTLGSPEDVFEVPFTLSSTSTVTVQTWGFGGGVNANGQTIGAGGFDPLIALFSGTGSSATMVTDLSGNPLIDADNLINPPWAFVGNCPSAGLVAIGSNNDCGDDWMQITLAAGTYTLLLSDANYIPAAINDNGSLSEGFTDLTAGVFQTCDPGANACITPNGNYAVDITSPGLVYPAPQTITFPAPASPVTYPVPPITLAATGGASGNPVVFSVISGPGTVSGTNGTTLTITDSGTVVVAANQAGNANYAAATQVTQSIVVNPPPAAILISPTPGSQFAGSSVTFTWTPGAGVTNYWFNLGTAPSGVNAKNIYSSGSVKVLAETVTGLPTNGETIYATLYSEIAGVFQPTIYTFYATGPAVLTAPAVGTKLTASTTFTWTPGTGIAHYWFNLGTSATSSGAKNVYSGSSTTALTASVTGIPQYGETLYATLYSYISGAWQPIVYTYTAGGAPVAATLTTPTPSSKLTSSGVTFTWSAGEGVTNYWFNLGTTDSGAGAKNLYSGSSTTLTSVTASGLPTNGETIYATLYSYIAGAWQPTVYTFTASGSPTPAALTTPTPTTQLTSSSVTFTWSQGSGVPYFWLNVGTGTSGAGAKNLYAGASTTATSVTVGGLPTNGKTIYATLYSYIGGVWQPTVYTYTAQ